MLEVNLENMYGLPSSLRAYVEIREKPNRKCAQPLGISFASDPSINLLLIMVKQTDCQPLLDTCCRNRQPVSLQPQGFPFLSPKLTPQFRRGGHPDT